MLPLHQVSLEFRDRSSKRVLGHTRAVTGIRASLLATQIFISGESTERRQYQYSAQQRSCSNLSRNSNSLRELVENLLCFLHIVHYARSAPSLDGFLSARSNEIGEHLHPANRVKKEKCAKRNIAYFDSVERPTSTLRMKLHSPYTTT